jgi:hypothetical protein
MTQFFLALAFLFGALAHLLQRHGEDKGSRTLVNWSTALSAVQLLAECLVWQIQ